MRLFYWGKNFRKTNIKAEHLYFFEHVEDLQQHLPQALEQLLKKQTFLLIKGSRGMALERLLPTLEELVDTK